MPEALVCSRGHMSTEADYCSECGVRLQGAVSDPLEASRRTAAQQCPDCGTPREQSDISFCEVCGYNFVTGAHGEIGILPESTSQEPEAAVETSATASEPLQTDESLLAAAAEVPRHGWQVVVFQGPPYGEGTALGESSSSEQGTVISLERPSNLIGRPDEAKGIFPEIAICRDEAVSRRHALLLLDGEQSLLLRDIGATNGTHLNGQALTPFTDSRLRSGDEIQLGHLTRLRVEAN